MHRRRSAVPDVLPSALLLAALLLPGATAGAACVESSAALCLQDARFELSARWELAGGGSGVARARDLTGDSGLFWFFQPRNVELVVKVLDGCPVNGHYWVFAAGLTNVGVELEVVDRGTVPARTKVYRSPVGRPFAPITDTAAFTCPGTLPPPAVDWSRDILHTDLRLDLATLTGIARITVERSSSRAVSLDVGGLVVEEVVDAHGPLRHRVVDGRLDVGVPDRGAPPEIAVRYSFQRRSARDGFLDAGATYLWPYHCGNLFPCHPDPDDGVSFTLEVVNPPPGEVVVHPREIPSPVPAYALGFAVGEYVYQQLGFTAAGTEVGVWYPAGQGDRALVGATGLVAAFDWLERTYGPYRLGKAVASVAVNWGGPSRGGLETHPLWQIGTADLDASLFHVHEAVHGWFGNGVRIRCWEDFVLSEGLASYLAARAVEATTGSADAVWDQYHRNLVLAVERRDTVAWPATCGEIDILHHPLFSNIPYMKGAFFLRKVEQEVGREDLDAALRSFYSTRAGEAAGVQDLLDTIEQETGFDPTALADAWLRSLGIPTS